VLAAAVLAACATARVDEVPVPAAEPARQEPGPKPAWDEPLQEVQAGCAALVDAVLAGRPPSSRLALRVVGDKAAIDNDLRIADEATGAWGCLLLVEAPRTQPPPPRRLIARERVRSSYVDGVDLVPNPARRTIERDLRRAENGGRRTGNIMSTGDPTADLLGHLAEGLIAGVDKLVRMQEAAELQDRLEATPAEIEQPKLRRYSYDSLRIEAGRRATARVAWHDRGAGTVRDAIGRVDETLVFRLDEGRHAGDQGGPAADGAPAADLSALAEWESTGPRMRLSTLLAHLREVGVERGEGLPGLMAAWAEPPAEGTATAAPGAAIPSPALGSLVRVEGAGGTGAGFFVAAQQVLTMARLVDGSDLVSVAGADGRSGFALVERRNRERGLALLRVTASGRVLDLAEGDDRGRAAMLVWPGGPPEGAAGRLLAGPVDGPLLWQAHTAVLPPSGSPVLVGDEVVAMVADTSEVGSILLPASQLRAFLGSARPQDRRQAATATSAQPASSAIPPSGVSQATGRGAPQASP
jgi:hypothetical protein